MGAPVMSFCRIDDKPIRTHEPVTEPDAGDHSDAMSQRGRGLAPVLRRDQPGGLDLQAFRIAEELSVPVMVCMDGFLLTHASERADLLEQARVDLTALNPSIWIDVSSSRGSLAICPRAGFADVPAPSW
jgi:hypothetical protein